MFCGKYWNIGFNMSDMSLWQWDTFFMEEQIGRFTYWSRSPSIKSLARDLCVIWICYSVQTHRYQDHCFAFCGKLFLWVSNVLFFAHRLVNWHILTGFTPLHIPLLWNFWPWQWSWGCLPMQCYYKAINIFFYLLIQPWNFYCEPRIH